MAVKPATVVITVQVPQVYDMRRATTASQRLLKAIEEAEGFRPIACTVKAGSVS